MLSNNYLPKTWVSPKQEARPSPIQGMGMFVRQTISQGEVVEIIGGQLMSEEEFEIFQKNSSCYNAIQIGETLHLVELLENTYRREGSINHSCDSNLWMADAVTVVARFDILSGQELTIDYALFTAQNDWSMDVVCNCGAQLCRRIITGNDWKLPDVQNRYHNHFSPFLNERIKQARMR